MNQDEKARIIELREEGLSYTEIAKRMDISKNTIKSFCRRNGITETKKDKRDLGVCEFCRKPISQPVARKKKRFCSDSCRNKWWNSHMDEVDRKASYECVCRYCDKTFFSYGNKNRKYCSHQCYINDRFGGEENACN
jgi:sigma-70 region 4 type 2